MTSLSSPTALIAALTPAGDPGSKAQARAVVDVLRRSAAQAPAEVGRITGLHRAAEKAANVPVYVVDRPRFQAANRELFDVMIGESMPQVSMGRLDLGAALAFLSTKVLGQYDPFHKRLLLVAPNVLKVEKELNLDAMDFRLWVCLHETTHAVQFAAAPWLAEHLHKLTGTLLGDLEEHSEGSAQRFVAWLNQALRGDDDTPITEALLDEAMQETMAEVSAIMALLEGHADVVMDAISPARLPSVRRIRAAFDKRRMSPTGLEKVLRRGLGIEDKLAQYRDGAAFVRAVVEQVGHAGLNRVFESAEMLPSAAEIREPERWVERTAAREA
ncbi:zinc-dependent metalloprotease [Bowdeniella nasicola]|nr:zinc-dependent metalloprotease [Bowdeniella nasicola]